MNKKYKGLYTPEAAIVMSIVLFVILMCILISFDLYSECLDDFLQVMKDFDFDSVGRFWFFNATKELINLEG